MEKHYCDHCGKELDGKKYSFRIKPLNLVSQIFDQTDTIELCKSCKDEFKTFVRNKAEPKDDN